MHAALKEGLRGRGEWVFVFLLLLGELFFLWQAAALPAGNQPIGPRTFPLVVAVGLIATTLYILLRLVRRRSEADEDDLVLVPAEDDETTIRDWRAVGVVFAALLLLCLLYERLGFVLTFALFVAALSTYFERRLWLVNLIVAFAVSVSFFLLFTRLLEISLPRGILGDLL